jgi:hypothetical protein
VEVLADAGSVFLCQHHHREYRDALVAARHMIRAWPGTGIHLAACLLAQYKCAGPDSSPGRAGKLICRRPGPIAASV